MQTAIRLPREMHVRLSQGEGGVSEEMRRRIERTFVEDALDPVTRELIAGIINLDQSIRVDLGAPWHGFQGPHAAFAAAVAQRIANYKPPAKPGAEQAVRDLLGAGLSGPDDLPETVGRTHERHDRRSHQYPHLQKVQHSKAAGLAGTLKTKGNKS